MCPPSWGRKIGVGYAEKETATHRAYKLETESIGSPGYGREILFFLPDRGRPCAFRESDTENAVRIKKKTLRGFRGVFTWSFLGCSSYGGFS